MSKPRICFTEWQQSRSGNLDKSNTSGALTKVAQVLDDNATDVFLQLCCRFCAR